MNAKATRALTGVALIVVAAVLLVVLKDNGGESGKTDGGKLQTIVVENAKPVGGIRRLTYNKGEQILFRVESDVSDEVHMHGYDIMKDVEAGGSVSFDFPATIEGVFEAELEGRKEQILELTVNP
jgi:hypothetical protein